MQKINMKYFGKSLQRLSGVLMLALILTLSQPLSTNAAFNKQINYQAQLSNSAGVPINTSKSIEFKLYTVATGGVALWTESHAAVAPSSDGLFSVMLGNTQSLASVDFNQTLYLGVNVASDGEMTPRKVLGAVPAAFEASQLDGHNAAYYLDNTDTQLTEAQVDAFVANNGYTATSHDAVTFANADGPSNSYLTRVGQVITRGLVSLTDNISGILGISNGGTGSSTASGARANLGAAASGANADITNLTGLTSITLPNNTVSANGLNVSGNGTAGQVLTSDADGSFSWSTAATNTDDQSLTSATLNTGTKELTIALEDGGSVTVDLTNLVNDADASITNEIQDLSLVGNNLKITGNVSATTIDLSTYLDNSDLLAGLSCANNEIAKYNGTAWACAADASGAGGTDDQTVDKFELTANTISLSLEGDAEVDKTISLAAYVNAVDSVNGNTGAVVLDTGDVAENGNLYYTNARVDSRVSNLSVGALSDIDTTTNAPNNGEVLQWNGTKWVPGAKTIDTDTQLTEAQVDAFVANNGYTTTSHDAVTLTTDPGVTSYLTLIGQSIKQSFINLGSSVTGVLGISNGGTGSSTASGARANLGLAIGTNVQGYNANTTFLGQTIETGEITDGTITAADLADTYLTSFSEVDGSTTNELITSATLSGTNLEIVDAGGTKTVNLASLSGTNTDTQDLSISGHIISLVDGGSVTVPDNDTTYTNLSEFTNDSGYITSFSEVDGSITNEIQDLSLTGNNLKITNNVGATTVDLSAYLDNTDNQLTEAQVDAFVANNGYTTTSHDAVTLTTDPGVTSYLTLIGQSIKQSFINLGSSVTGVLGISNGGTGINAAPVSNQILVGNASGGYDLVDKSTLDTNMYNTNGIIPAGTRAVTMNGDLNFDSNTLVIDSSANKVGVGIAIPLAKLDVAGDIKLGNVAGVAIQFPAGAAIRTSIPGSSTYLDMGNIIVRDGNGAVGSANTHLRVSGSGVFGRSIAYYNATLPNSGLLVEGNVGIGTITPTEKLHVVGNAIISGLVTASTTANVKVDANGKLYSDASDERLKNIEGDFNKGIDALLNVQPITYTWNELSGIADGGVAESGFSAQNLQLSIPEAVIDRNDGYLGLNTKPILATVVNAIKEMWTAITHNTTEIDDLKARVQELESAARGGASSQQSTASSHSSTVTETENTTEEVTEYQEEQATSTGQESATTTISTTTDTEIATDVASTTTGQENATTASLSEVAITESTAVAVQEATTTPPATSTTTQSTSTNTKTESTEETIPEQEEVQEQSQDAATTTQKTFASFVEDYADEITEESQEDEGILSTLTPTTIDTIVEVVHSTSTNKEAE